MSLPPDRARAYGLGALTGAFAAVALLARRRQRAVAVAASPACGALAVALGERQQRSEAGSLLPGRLCRRRG